MQSPWKKHFPSLFDTKIHYLDSAATTQVPDLVINSIGQYLTNGCGNPGRGSYSQSELASLAIANCREKVAKFIDCSSTQIVFTKGATESINMVANSLRNSLTENDSILVTQSEHHANLLPWQRLCEQTGAKLNILPINPQGELETKELDNLLSQNCKFFAVSHCSNVIGLVNPIKQLCEMANKYNTLTLIDGAQAISHETVSMTDTGCDFYAFSGHKIYASGGSGILYSKNPECLSPLLLGGGIVKRTSMKQHQLQDGINKLEAGSSNMVSLIGLSAAIDFIESISINKVAEYEKRLTKELFDNISRLENYVIISHPKSSSIVSFYHRTIHCHDIASVLAESNISIRAGHHCAQPCVEALGAKHCLRASVGMYNDSDDINALVNGLVLAEKTLA